MDILNFYKIKYYLCLTRKLIKKLELLHILVDYKKKYSIKTFINTGDNLYSRYMR